MMDILLIQTAQELTEVRQATTKNIGESEESGFRVSVAGPMNDTLSAYASLRWNDYEGPNNHWIRELDKNDLKHPNTVDTTTNPRHVRDTVSAMLELTLGI